MFKKYTVIAVMLVAGLFVTSGVYADTEVNTGDAKSDVKVTTEAGMNKLDLGGFSFGDTDVEISDNGAFSDNFVVVNNYNRFTVNQTNNTTVNNNINVNADTGGNFAFGNSRGDTEIRTGDATSNVVVETKAGINELKLDCDDCNNSTSVEVSDNSAFSDNTVRINNNNRLDIDQDNDTDVDNDVEVNLNTGDNVSVLGGYGHYDKDYDRKYYDRDKDRKDHDYKKDSDKYDFDHKKDRKYKDDKYDNRYEPYRLNKFDGYDHRDYDKKYDNDRKDDHKKHKYSDYKRDYKYAYKFDHDKYDRYWDKYERQYFDRLNKLRAYYADHFFKKYQYEKPDFDKRKFVKHYDFYKVKKDHDRKDHRDKCDCDKDRKFEKSKYNFTKHDDGKYKKPYRFTKYDNRDKFVKRDFDKYDRDWNKYRFSKSDKDFKRDYKSNKYNKHIYPVLVVKAFDYDRKSKCYTQSSFDKGKFRFPGQKGYNVLHI